MTIKLYTNKSPNNKLEKDLLEVGEIQGIFRGGFNLVSPTIQIVREWVDFNYVFIESLGNRYYYVSSISNVVNGLWNVSLLEDPLMSHKEAIKALKVTVSRNESMRNNDLIDDRLCVSAKTVVDVIEFPQHPFTVSTDAHSLKFILQVIGEQEQSSE